MTELEKKQNAIAENLVREYWGDMLHYYPFDSSRERGVAVIEDNGYVVTFDIGTWTDIYFETTRDALVEFEVDRVGCYPAPIVDLMTQFLEETEDDGHDI